MRAAWAAASPSPSPTPATIAAAELLFEALPETLAAKREAFAAISRHASPQAIVTSTTSSILVTDLVPMVTRPERFFNMHWLNPAYVIPVVCGVAPGYIVPRLQALVMNEAARTLGQLRHAGLWRPPADPQA